MVFVIIYALFIFVDLAVAKASNVSPSQHQCVVGGGCAPAHTTALALCPAHLVLFLSTSAASDPPACAPLPPL